MDNNRQRINRHDMLYRLDAICPGILDLRILHRPGSIGNINGTVDKRCNAGAGAAARDGNGHIRRHFTVRLGPGQCDIHQRIRAFILNRPGRADIGAVHLSSF